MKHISKSTLLTLVTTSTLLVSGCGESTSSSAGESFNQGSDSSNSGGDQTLVFDKATFLSDITDHVLIPTYKSFESLAMEQAQAINTFCAAQISNSAELTAQKESAQMSWRQAMNQWQQIEVMQVGPLTSDSNALRNKIYSWPVTNQCAVDQDVGHYENGSINGAAYDITRRTETRKGLDALEYLLFAPNANHSCSNASLAPSGWNDRPESERLVARCEFAVEVANDLVINASSLVSQWQDGYAANIKSAGSQSSDFGSQEEAINHISDAIFYIDSVTKDAKVAAPVGLKDNSCGSAACIADIESNMSNNALANVENNLVGLSKLFLGNAVDAADEDKKIGFDDFLVAVDAGDEADQMIAKLIAAIEISQALQAQGTTMQDAVQNNPQSVQELHQNIKNVTDELKSVFISNLALQLPATSAGDND